jgi:6-phosphogluconolactonase (cycloisomerase 2 family)
MHSMIPSADGQFVYASDLGIDKIMIYKVDQKTGKLTPGAVPYVEVKAGDGPRHFAITLNGNFAFSAGELSSSINSFQIVKNSGALVPLERLSMLPSDFTGKSSAADIHLSPDGKFFTLPIVGMKHCNLQCRCTDWKTNPCWPCRYAWKTSPQLQYGCKRRFAFCRKS